MPEQTTTPSKRITIRKHKKDLSLSSSQRFKVKGLIQKLMKDYKSVAEKRGSKNFDTQRWIKNNL